MGEYECGFDDVADLAGAGGDVVEGSPAAGEDGEAAFADAAQAAQESVAGAVVDVEDPVTGGVFDRGVHADPGAVVAAVSQRGQIKVSCGPMQLEAFFAVMYYAGLRPAEVVNLRRHNLRLPEEGWGELVFEQSAPATGAAWTDSGTRREIRQLKGREVGERRVAPCPPELTRHLHRHLDEHGIDEEGRLFRGVQTGGEVPEGTYCRVWKKARRAALSTEDCASPLAARPYDLRHACVSTWLNAGVPGPQVAEWAGHGLDVLYRIYAKCLAGQEDSIRQRIDNMLINANEDATTG
jgi:hypothetical protein